MSGELPPWSEDPDAEIEPTIGEARREQNEFHMRVALLGLRRLGLPITKAVVNPAGAEEVGAFCLEHGLELVVDPDRPKEAGVGFRWIEE